MLSKGAAENGNIRFEETTIEAFPLLSESDGTNCSPA
jgi:hypothetical protein